MPATAPFAYDDRIILRSGTFGAKYIHYPLKNIGTIQVAQLHGHEDETYIAALRQTTSAPIWKAFKVRTPEDVAAADASSADLILLDNGYGTGETFDWSLVQSVHRPYLLAGGLTPENVTEAVKTLQPFGVDVSSGIETDGHKDPEKMRKFLDTVRNL